MNVKEAREIVQGMDLSAEAILKIDDILSPYGDGEIPDEIIDKILAIVDVEMDATKLAADVYQAGVEITDEFLSKVNNEADKIATDIKSAKQ